jgi:predicted lipoprotein with Yx(FWY)xxD motif
VERALVGTVERPDGSQQVTLAGWPLYRYANDAKPGDILGQGAGGSWFVATPQGKKAQAVTGAATAAVALVVMKVGKLGSIVTDREGMTLYRFDKDDPKGPKSNCEGDCAKTWLPLLGSSDNVEVSGLDRALVGTVTRADGSKQITLAGWPLYRFVKDQVPCDTKGQGVGGTWFAITPQGKKAGV